MRGFSSIAAGAARSCVIDADGVASCWGELGLDGATTVEASPVAVDPSLPFSQLSAFGKLVCGVAPDGVARCWGPNDHGQLGQGTIGAGSATPAIVGTGRVFASITASDGAPCGVTPANEALCWGNNDKGQVGADLGPLDVQSPIAIAGALRMREISTSLDFACGITTGEEAYCWGSNANGQLGTGAPISATDTSRVPVKVTGGQRWRSITTGDAFACGVTTAGAAHCWGRNEARFGDGGMTSSSTPVAVTGGHVFARVDAGRDFACGVTDAGAAFCWGSNTHGQLGAGAAVGTTPSAAPVAVAGGLAFAELRASDGDHVCAIAMDRQSVYCWGRNHVGQLGTGAASADRTPEPVLVAL